MDWVEALAGGVVLLPLMFVVGLQLTPADFERVMRTPRAVIGGTLGQLLLLPAMTWVVVTLVGVSPVLAAGAMLIAATPGAGASQVFAAVARANVALSVTLTAVASLVAVVSLPVLTALGLRVFLANAAEVEIPVLFLIGQLVFFLGLPIGLGMWMRQRRPDIAARYVKIGNRVVVIGIVVLTILGIASGEMNLPSGGDLGLGVAAALGWTVGAMALGYGLAVALRLDGDDRFTFLIEYGARNVALAIVIAIGSLRSIELALFAGVYSIAGFPIVLGLAVLRGRTRAGSEAPAA